MITAARGDAHFDDVRNVLTDEAVKGLCRDARGKQVVSHTYVRDIRGVQFVAVVYTRISESSRTRRGAVNPAGFLVARTGRTPDDLYIDVVCGPGQGRALVKEALRFARARGYRTASLSALPHVVEFYPQFRFLAGDGDPCAPGASAQRVAAPGGADESGYRFRKCIQGTTEADNYVPRGPEQNRYRLPDTRTSEQSPSPPARRSPAPSARRSPAPPARRSRSRSWNIDLVTPSPSFVNLTRN
jgi:hypothetical protein